MKTRILFHLVFLLSMFTKQLIFGSKIFIKEYEKDYDQTLRFLENIEAKLKTNLKSVVKMALPYLMKMSERVNISSSCVRSATRFLMDLPMLKEWTLQLLDSLGKPTAGIFSLTMWWTQGDYDQCLNLKIPQSSSVSVFKRNNIVSGKYCAAMLEFPSFKPKVIDAITGYKNNSLINLVNDIIKPYPLSNLLKAINYSTTEARFDICIPSTCSENDLENIGRWFFADRINFHIDNCDTKQQKIKYSTAQLICFSVFCFLIAWVVLGTTTELLLNTNIARFHFKSRYLEPFVAVSAFKSGKKLFSPVLQENTKALCGIKFLLMCLIIFGHEVITLTADLTIGEHNLYIFEMIGNHFYNIFVQAPILLETYFFISGFLTCYLRKENGKRSKTKYLLLFIKRFIRLTIPVACVLAVAIVMPHFGDGPHWYKIIRQGNNFERNWWMFILHTHIFVDFGVKLHMLTFTWFVSNLVILTLFTMPILYVQERWPKVGFAVLFACIIGGLTLYISYIFSYGCYGFLSKQIDFSKTHKYLTVYNRPYYFHLSMYSFGLLLGIILNSKTVKIKKAILISGWIISIVLMLFVIFFPHRYINQIYSDQKVLMILQSVLPFTWALGISWVCVVCTTGYGGIVNRFLSLKPFVILNHLIMWVYMLHVFVIVYIFGKTRKPQMISDLNMWMLFSFVMFLTLIASFIFYLFVESPISYLMSKIFAVSTSKMFLVSSSKQNDIQKHNTNL